MNIYVAVLVIFVTALAAMLWAAWKTGEACRVTLARLADPRPLPGECEHEYTPNEAGTYEWCQKCDSVRPIELPRAGRLEIDGPFDLPAALILTGPYGPFPVDTGPLLILSDKMAANVALEREIEQRCAEAEAKIPQRWR